MPRKSPKPKLKDVLPGDILYWPHSNFVSMVVNEKGNQIWLNDEGKWDSGILVQEHLEASEWRKIGTVRGTGKIWKKLAVGD